MEVSQLFPSEPVQGMVVDDAALCRKPRQPREVLLLAQLVLNGRHATLLPITARSLSHLEIPKASQTHDRSNFPCC